MPTDAAIVDIGGGASTLVDDLLSMNYSNVTVLDISKRGLDFTRKRLGSRADSVKWIEDDVLSLDPAALSVDLWHDRAVFHFLVKEEDRMRYCDVLGSAVRPGGFVVMATFAPDGPLKCSGLEVVRYGTHSLLRAVGRGFKLVASQREQHLTPSGMPQEFLYCLLQKPG